MRQHTMVSCPCGAAYISEIYIGCLACSNGKPRPSLMEQCGLCDRAILETEYIWTDGLPTSSICLECATAHNILNFPCIPMIRGKIWTAEDIKELLRPRVAMERQDSP